MVCIQGAPSFKATGVFLIKLLAGTAGMRDEYNYRNCQSLFGYAYGVHQRSCGVCQLCGAGGAAPSFELWRQLTVEHLIGKKQGGYLKDIKHLVSEFFPELDATAQVELACAIDVKNTVTACSFCNSTTSRNVSISMRELLAVAVSESRQSEAIVKYISAATREILEGKRRVVAWKLRAIRRQYETSFLPSLPSPRTLYCGFEGGSVYTSERGGKFLATLDESTIAGLLPEDELDGIGLVKDIEFSSESERAAYLLRSFGPPRR